METITIPPAQRPFVVALFVRERTEKAEDEAVHLFTMVVMAEDSAKAVASASTQLIASWPTDDLTVELGHAIPFVSIVAAVESLVTREIVVEQPEGDDVCGE